ncbi:uncharacterized protein TNCV_3808151 [Trichonephila clavipes]|nr:uncharacterized protein TNCV_3808151 [Trichonephila clavipes]
MSLDNVNPEFETMTTMPLPVFGFLDHDSSIKTNQQIEREMEVLCVARQEQIEVGRWSLIQIMVIVRLLSTSHCTLSKLSIRSHRLRTGHYRIMKFDRDGRRFYRNCDNCLDTELTSAHIFDCPAILAALQKIGILLSSTNLYVDNIEDIARTVIWAHMIIFDLLPSWIRYHHHHHARFSDT